MTYQSRHIPIKKSIGTLLFVLIVCFCKPSYATDNWQAWLDQFSAQTPYGSVKKTSQWVPKKNEFVKIKNGSQSVEFHIKPDGKAESHSWQQLDSEFMKKAQHYFVPGVDISGRSKLIASNINYYIQKRKKSELLIIETGAAHAFNYFLKEPERPVHYVSYPYNENSDFLNLDYQYVENVCKSNISEPKYLQLCEKPYSPEHARMLYLAPLFYFRKSIHDSLNITVDDFTKQSVAESHTIIIMDYHLLVEKTLVEGFPDATILKALGYDRIKVVIEDVPPGKDYSFQEIREIVDNKQNLATSNRELLQLKLESLDMEIQLGDTSGPEALEYRSHLIKAIRYLDEGRGYRVVKTNYWLEKLQKISSDIPVVLNGLN